MRGSKPVELTFRRKIKHNQHPKYLGVTLDPQLLMNRQAALLEVEAKRRVGALRALAGTDWGCSKGNLRMVYCGYVRGALLPSALRALPPLPSPRSARAWLPSRTRQ